MKGFVLNHLILYMPLYSSILYPWSNIDKDVYYIAFIKYLRFEKKILENIFFPKTFAMLKVKYQEDGVNVIQFRKYNNNNYNIIKYHNIKKYNII